MVDQPRRFDTESHGAGPSNLNASDSSATSLIRRVDQNSFQWSRVPYFLFTSDNNRTNKNNEEQLFVPPPRSGAASVVVNGKLYVFGGFGGGTGRLDDFYVFDFSTLTWDVVETIGDEKPGCRENNGACVISGSSSSHSKIIVFGGYNGSTWLSDLWSYDITSRRWTCIQESLASSPSSSSNDADNVNDETTTTTTSAVIDTSTMAAGVPSVGNGRVLGGVTARNNDRTNLSRKRPCCRFGYVSLVHDNKFILWGGFDGTKWMNDMWIFDFDSDKWNEIQQLGIPPSRRSCPAWAKDEKFVYIHGGFDGIERKEE
jgi:N-acetylneuraminic acid mutarotase